MKISILVPLFNEFSSVKITLPNIYSAAKSLKNWWEILIILRESKTFKRKDLSFFAGKKEVKIITTDILGKYEAIKQGLIVAKGDILIMCDGDVIPHQNAFTELEKPISMNIADITLSRPSVKKVRKHNFISKKLESWSNISFLIWHETRRTNKECLWALPGYLYAIRKEYVSEKIGLSIIEDASIGIYAKKENARFIYASDAVVEILPPRTLKDWIKQKIRTRVGWARLHRIYPGEVSKLNSSLNKSISILIEREHNRSDIVSLRYFDRLMRLVADLISLSKIWKAGHWRSVKTSKYWNKYD